MKLAPELCNERFFRLNVNIELTEHQEESVDAGEDEGVPALVLIVDDRVDAVADGQGKQDHSQVPARRAGQFLNGFHSGNLTLRP